MNKRNNIMINENVYRVHQVYDLYAANENGEVIHIIKKVPMKGIKKHPGYMHCKVRKYGERQKSYLVHRFVWECFNGLIPEEKVIDHINNNKEDNRLCNLQLVTPQENCKKSAKNRDYTFAAKNHKNKKCVKAINIETNEVLYFNSMYSIKQHLGINPGTVKMVCEGLNGCKSGISKKDGKSYKFEYVKKEDMPDNFLKSANKRLRKFSDEERKKNQCEASKKWLNKEYKCPRCDKIIKNSNRQYHKKICSNNE